MRIYDLTPTNGRKSFYGKAKVIIDDHGNETLQSYNTRICTRTTTGEIKRFWDGWTTTTGTHIKAFCGMNKAQFTALPLEEQDGKPHDSGGRVLTNKESYAAMMGRRYAG